MRTLVAILRGLHGWVVLVLFWLRELAGWVLLVLGLLIFYQCFVFLVGTPRILQVIPLFFIGLIVFRAGIHMLRISAAALVCLKAQDQADQSFDAANRRRNAPPARLVVRPFELGPPRG